MWTVSYTREFDRWWETLTLSQQRRLLVVIQMLCDLGPTLGFPYSSDVKGSGTGACEN